MNKKGNIMIIVIVVWIIIAIIMVGSVVLLYKNTVGARECRNDSDCPSNNYCGSDFACHQFKIVEQTENRYTGAAIIVGIAIVVAAYILRGHDFKRKGKRTELPLQYYYETKGPDNYSYSDDQLAQKWK